MSSLINPIHVTGKVQFGAERRTSERTAANLRAVLRFPDRPQAIQGSVIDISTGGVGFICQQAVAPNSKCTIEFDLPRAEGGAGRVAPISSLVINTMQVVGQAYQFRVNLRFTVMPPAVRMQIENFVQQSMKRA